VVGLRPARSSSTAAAAKPGMPPRVIRVTKPTEPTIEKPRSLSSTAIQELRPKKPISAKNHSPNAITVRRRYSGANRVATAPRCGP
jgi:hypothetical protein